MTIVFVYKYQNIIVFINNKLHLNSGINKANIYIFFIFAVNKQTVRNTYMLNIIILRVGNLHEN